MPSTVPNKPMNGLTEDGDQGSGLELFAGDHDRIQAAGFAEGAQKSPVGGARGAQHVPLGKNDGPGVNGKDQEDGQNGDGQWAAAANHFPDVDLQKECGRFRVQTVS